jgi:putative transposase
VYHVYNRGVEKRRIFSDHLDYQRFKLQMRKALQAEPSVSLLAYSLMPNHYHLLIRQADAKAMARFMRRLGTAYVMYFNIRHKRVGPLFQGKYKGIRIVAPGDLMVVSRYIHMNAEAAGLGWQQHQHSSLRAYLEPSPDDWVNSAPVLELFDQPVDYRDYIARGKLRP